MNIPMSSLGRIGTGNKGSIDDNDDEQSGVCTRRCVCTCVAVAIAAFVGHYLFAGNAPSTALSKPSGNNITTQHATMEQFGPPQHEPTASETFGPYRTPEHRMNEFLARFDKARTLPQFPTDKIKMEGGIPVITADDVRNVLATHRIFKAVLPDGRNLTGFVYQDSRTHKSYVGYLCKNYAGNMELINYPPLFGHVVKSDDVDGLNRLFRGDADDFLYPAASFSINFI